MTGAEVKPPLTGPELTEVLGAIEKTLRYIEKLDGQMAGELSDQLPDPWKTTESECLEWFRRQHNRLQLQASILRHIATLEEPLDRLLGNSIIFTGVLNTGSAVSGVWDDCTRQALRIVELIGRPQVDRLLIRVDHPDLQYNYVWFDLLAEDTILEAV